MALLRKVAAIISERLFDLAAVDSMEVGKNRLEALGDVEETADFIRTYCDIMENTAASSCRSRTRTLPVPQHQRAQTLRCVGRDCALQLPGGALRRADGGRDPGGQHGRACRPRTRPSARRCSCSASTMRHPGRRRQHGDGPEGDRPRLVDHPGVDGFTFTGSYRVGMEIYAKGGARPRLRPVITEMGGKNPAIVGKSADPTWRRRVWRAAFGLTGQKCSACSRVYVHEEVRAAFLEKLVAHANAVKIGDPTHSDNWMGPVINSRAFENYEHFTAELRAAASAHRWQDPRRQRLTT